MPNYEDTEGFFYSWNMGPVHFIAVNTEAYYFVQYGLKPLSRQYEWLINDLEVRTLIVISQPRYICNYFLFIHYCFV